MLLIFPSSAQSPSPYYAITTFSPFPSQFEYDETGNSTQLFLLGALIFYLIPTTISRLTKGPDEDANKTLKEKVSQFLYSTSPLTTTTLFLISVLCPS